MTDRFKAQASLTSGVALKDSNGDPVAQTGTSDGYAYVFTVNNLISYHWTSADDTDAPTATALPDYVIGVASDGVAAGLVYHVIDGAWVPTGADVQNLYGG